MQVGDHAVAEPRAQPRLEPGREALVGRQAEPGGQAVAQGEDLGHPSRGGQARADHRQQ